MKCDREMNCGYLYTGKKIDFANVPIFGEHTVKNTQRFDVPKYPEIDQNTRRQLSFFWLPEEVNLNVDAANWDMKLTEEQRKVIRRVLQKLIFFDSLQGRAPFLTFGQVASVPEVENNVLAWTFFEGVIHSRSYTHIARTVFPDTERFFDEAFEIPVLKKHEKSIYEEYNRFYEKVVEYVYMDLKRMEKSAEFMREFKTSLLKALVEINKLEGIRFYSGFATVWAIHDVYGTIPGITEILKFICRDENLHLALVQRYLNVLAKREDEGFTRIFAEISPWIRGSYAKAAEEEFEWIDFLFEDSGLNVIGYNADIAKEYIKYVTDRRLAAIKIEPLFNVKKNPIPWINKYVMKGEDGERTGFVAETLPQEKSATSEYLLGAVCGDIDDSAFEV